MTSGSDAPDGVPDERDTPEQRPDTLTRGFLFADLRGYTQFVEARGATAAAELLNRYRVLVREAVSAYRGAEIKTEGDSFFVVFSSVSRAVECGLAIQGDANSANDTEPDAPIRIGIGVHAGETVEADGGYVGSAVNMAARLCSVAEPGEVLVSETVRALVSNTVPARFEPVGRRRLKGIAEPVAVYRAVATGGAFSAARVRRLPRAAILAAGALSLVAAVTVALVVLRPGDASSGGAASDSALPSTSGDLAVTAIVVPPLDPETGIPAVQLEPGRYRFTELSVPITFTISGGNWWAYRDYVDASGIALLADDVTELPTMPENYIGWVDFGRVQVVFENGCLDDDTILLESSPRALVEWLQANEVLEASSAAPVNLGGYSGLSVEIETAMSPGDDPCEADGEVPRTYLFPVGQDSYGIFAEERLTVITLDVNGRPFSILINGPTSSFDALTEAAQPILESLRIEN